MKLDKAIEILEALWVGIDIEELPEDQPALQLGIEALKRVKAGRVTLNIHFDDKLPGED